MLKRNCGSSPVAFQKLVRIHSGTKPLERSLSRREKGIQEQSSKWEGKELA
jgi:hypothetical protein